MLATLFAQAESTWQLIVAALLGGGIAKAAEFAVRLLQTRREVSQQDRQQKREDRDDAIAHMERLLNRAEKQLEARDRQIAVLSTAANRATVRAERAVVWIQHLEATLKLHKIPFEPYREDDGAPPSQQAIETDVADGGYP